MHQSSLDKMTAFRDAHLRGRETEALRILDLGSQDINGTYRPLFARPPWQYAGLDLVAGSNVDLVLRSPYRWREIPSGSADVVVSGQAFEHIRYCWATMLEIARVLRPGGLCCLIAPSSGPEHRYPVDCWRFYADGMAALAHWARLEVLEASVQSQDLGYADGSDTWRDAVLVCRKQDLGAWRNLRRCLRLRLRRWAVGLDGA